MQGIQVYVRMPVCSFFLYSTSQLFVSDDVISRPGEFFDCFKWQHFIRRKYRFEKLKPSKGAEDKGKNGR